MSDFELELHHRDGAKDVVHATHAEWFRSLPRWLKLAYLFVAIPAWMVIAINSLSGNSKALSSVVAFCIFAMVAIAAIVHERRSKKISQNG